MAVPHAGCRGGEAVVFKAGPDAGCENERQSQTLVVDGRGRGSHGSPRRWLWAGESVLLMAIEDTGCWGPEAAFLKAVLIAGCGGVERGGL